VIDVIDLQFAVTGVKRLKRYFNGVNKRAANLEPFMKKTAKTLERSMKKTVREGGRPKKWPGLSDWTKAKLSLTGKGRKKPLLGSDLIRSVRILRISRNELKYGTGYKPLKTGGSVARVTQYGATFKIPAHRPQGNYHWTAPTQQHNKKFWRVPFPWGWRMMSKLKFPKGKERVILPARPFLVIQPEDRQKILLDLIKHIFKAEPAGSGGKK